MTQPILTVALSVLNGGAFLELAVRSILHQSFTGWELIIIDDGSTDGSVNKLYNINDPRIFITQDGLSKGLSNRLNQAIFMARGKYLARMDHDDISHPDRFIRQINYLEKHQEVDLIATACVTINNANEVIGHLPFDSTHEKICQKPWLGFYMPHPTWMGRIEWFQKNQYQDPGPYCCEDNELLLRAHNSSIYYALPDKLLAYRIRKYTPIRKSLRTRFSLLGIQVRYFYQYKNIKFIVLAIVAVIFRLILDMLRIVSLPFLLLRNKASNQELLKDKIEWEKIISSIKSL